MRTPRPWIDTYIYIYIFRFTYKLHIYTCLHTHSDIHTSTRMYTICICTHTHIYIYIYITGANVTPRHGWTCIGAAAACKCRQYELPDCGGRVLKSYIYIYIWMRLKMAFPMSMDYSLVSQITVWRAYTRPMFKHVHIYIIFQKTVINN